MPSSAPFIPAKPTLTINPASTTPGTQVTFTCTTTDTNVASYSFYKNGALFQQQTGKVLTFSAVESQSGDFTCFTTIDGENSAQSEVVAFTVAGEITILEMCMIVV